MTYLLSQVDEFRSYVKPTINPTLSEFCMKLTGISQDTVDNSPIFIDVLNQFQEFLAKYNLFQSSSAVFVTGNDEMQRHTSDIDDE